MFESKTRRLSRCVPVLVALAGALALTAPGMAQNLPEGASVQDGTIVLSANNDIIRLMTERGIINWDSFNIGPGNTVEFRMDHGDAAAILNRVIGNDPSIIQGMLRSIETGTGETAGAVYLVNPAGVVFTSNATINVGTLFAAAGKISDSDFDHGINSFTDIEGTVANFGAIHAHNAVHMIGRHVLNMGEISVSEDLGVISLTASNDTVTISENPGALGGRYSVRITWDDSEQLDTGVMNTGLLEASGEESEIYLGAGDVYSTAVMIGRDTNQTGGGASLHAESIFFGAEDSNNDVLSANVTLTSDLAASDINAILHPDVQAIVDADDILMGANFEDTISIETNHALFAGTVDASSPGAESLEIETFGTWEGNVEFRDSVGETNPLHQLFVEGQSIFDFAGGSGSLATTDSQTYEGAVELRSNAALQGSTIAFEQTIDGGFDLTIDGDVVFEGDVDIAQLLVDGQATIDTDVITTSGTQEYIDAVTILTDAVLDGQIVTFRSTVDGSIELTIDGDAVFEGDVGDITPLVELLVRGETTFDFTGGTGSIETTDAQTYENAVTLLSNAVLNGQTIHFEQTVNGGFGLTIEGDAVFEGDVGIAQLLVEGLASIDTSQITTTGTQTYTDVVELLSSATLSGSEISVGADISGGTGNEDLTLISTAGSTVTGAIEDLRDLFVQTGHLEAGSIDLTGNLNASNANVTTLQDGIQVAGSITSNQNVTSNTFITANATDIDGALIANDGNIDITNLLRAGSASAMGHVLANEADVANALEALNGDIVIISHMGAGSAFASGSIGAQSAAVDGATTAAGGNVAITTNAVFGGAVTAADSVGIGGDVSFGDHVAAQGGDIGVGGQVTLTGNVAMNAADQIVLLSNVNGQNFALLLDAASAIHLHGNVHVGQLVTGAAGSTNIHVQGITARELVQINNALHLHGDLEVRVTDFSPNAFAIEFQSIDGSHALTVIAEQGSIRFRDALGGTVALGGLLVNAGPNGERIVFDTANGANNPANPFVRVNSDVLLNVGNPLPADPALALIGATGDLWLELSGGTFQMGHGQKLTALGDIIIDAGHAVLGDLTALGGIVIDAPQIDILLREPGVGNFDQGVDFVAGQGITFSSVPTLVGGAALPPPRFAVKDGNVSPTLQGFLVLALDEDITPDALLEDAFVFLDLSATGVTIEDLSEALAALAPTDVEDEELDDDAQLSATDRERLEQMGLNIRDLTDVELVSRAETRIGLYDDSADPLSPEEVLARRMFAVALPRLDARPVDNILAMHEDLLVRISDGRDAMRDAWRDFNQQHEYPDAADFGLFLIDHEHEYPLALETLRGIGNFERAATALGTTMKEGRERIMRGADGLYAVYAPPGMQPSELERAVIALTEMER